MTETPGKYGTRASQAAVTFKVLSIDLPLPTEIAEHIQSQPKPDLWLHKAISRQIEDDLKVFQAKS